MIDAVKKYITRKCVTDKISYISEQQIEELEKLVTLHGDNVFMRRLSPLSARTIQDTIPLMLANNIVTIAHNIEQIANVKRNSLEHYTLIYGENASVVYSRLREKCIVSEKSMIERHGLLDGKKKWEKVKKSRQQQSTLEFYIKKYGSQGEQLYNEYRARLKKSNTLEGYKERLGEEEGEKAYYDRYPTPNYTNNYKKYKQAVYRYSEKVYNENIDTLNPDRHPRTRMGIAGGWQLDHIKPVNECFKENIPIEVAGNIHNLQLLPWEENMKKNRKS